jgi:uroporphyrinogen III methyltransferase/synthase
LIEIVERPPANLPEFAKYEWIVFTSLHGVRGFFAALTGCGLDARALGDAKVAAVGPKTASELRRYGIRAALVPSEHRAHALVEELASKASARGRVLFPGGTLALDVIPEGLRAHGIEVDFLEVYATIARPLPEETRARISHGVDAILLYSPSAACGLHESGVDFGEARIAAIGPTTAEAARRLGLPVHIVPEVYGDAGMIAALESAFSPSEVRA